MRIGILIPAYQPDGKLAALVEELGAAGLETVIVDDGSTVGGEVFAALRDRPGVTVLAYSPNQGKGHALKAGLRHMAGVGFDGAVTADADGQHTVHDIRRMAGALAAEPAKLVLGMRDVAQMPPKSKTGNSLTRFLFKVLYGIDLKDTQTGLRAIPLNGETTRGLLELPGERYEYEMEMLITSPSLFPAGLLELPIETVYIDDNSSSHFRPLRDGGKIYAVLFKNLPGLLCSSLAAFGMDYVLFHFLYYHVFRHSVLATACARAVSGTCNYLMNKNVVFRREKGDYTFFNYWKLALCILAVNAALMYLLVDVLGSPAFLMKIIVECAMYIISFTAQNKMANKKRT